MNCTYSRQYCPYILLDVYGHGKPIPPNLEWLSGLAGNYLDEFWPHLISDLWVSFRDRKLDTMLEPLISDDLKMSRQRANSVPTCVRLWTLVQLDLMISQVIWQDTPMSQERQGKARGPHEGSGHRVRTARYLAWGDGKERVERYSGRRVQTTKQEVSDTFPRFWGFLAW